MNLKLWQALLVGIVISVLIMLCPKFNMRTGNYGWYLPFWINAIGAIVAGWNISRCVDIFINRVKTVGIWLKNIGKNSIAYLCLNQIVILGTTKVLNIINVNGILAKVLILVLTLSILFAFEKLICNTRLKVLIGK